MHKLRAGWKAIYAASILAALAACPTAHAQKERPIPPPLVLQGLDHTTAPLDGAWQFHTGDDLAWAAPGFDDSGWETQQTGVPWEDQGHYGYAGFAWYRRHLVLPAGEINDAQLALYVPGIDSAYEVYWNGVRVGGNGKLPPHPQWYVVFSGSQELSDTQIPEAIRLGAPQSGVLAIRVWKAPIVFFSFPFEGGLVTMARVGTAEAVTALKEADRYDWLRASQFTIAVTLLTTVAGILAALLWLRNRRRTMLLWLAIVLFYPLERFCLTGVPGLATFRVGYGLIGPSIGLYGAALWFLLLDLLGLDQNRQLVRWTRILAVIEVGMDLTDGFLQLFDWSKGHAFFFLICDVVLTVPPVVLELWSIVLLLFAFRKRLDAARWMLAITALLSAGRRRYRTLPGWATAGRI
jgi:hypothetical protein